MTQMEWLGTDAGLTCGNIAVVISHCLIIHYHHDTAIWRALLVTATSSSTVDIHSRFCTQCRVVSAGPNCDGTYTFATSLRASSFGGSGLVAGVNILHVSNTDCPRTMWHETGPALAEDAGAHPLRPKDDECHERVRATGSASRSGGRWTWGGPTHRLDGLCCDQQSFRGRPRAVIATSMCARSATRDAQRPCAHSHDGRELQQAEYGKPDGHVEGRAV